MICFDRCNDGCFNLIEVYIGNGICVVGLLDGLGGCVLFKILYMDVVGIWRSSKDVFCLVDWKRGVGVVFLLWCERRCVVGGWCVRVLKFDIVGCVR